MLLKKMFLAFCTLVVIAPSLKAMQSPIKDSITLKDQKITLPDKKYSKISDKLIIDGTVKVTGKKGQTFTLEKSCLIKKGAKLIINTNIILKLVCTDGNTQPIQFEDDKGRIIFYDASLQISNYDTIHIPTGILEFHGKCSLDCNKCVLLQKPYPFYIDPLGTLEIIAENGIRIE